MRIHIHTYPNFIQIFSGYRIGIWHLTQPYSSVFVDDFFSFFIVKLDPFSHSQPASLFLVRVSLQYKNYGHLCYFFICFSFDQ